MIFSDTKKLRVITITNLSLVKIVAAGKYFGRYVFSQVIVSRESNHVGSILSLL